MLTVGIPAGGGPRRTADTTPRRAAGGGQADLPGPAAGGQADTPAAATLFYRGAYIHTYIHDCAMGEGGYGRGPIGEAGSRLIRLPGLGAL